MMLIMIKPYKFRLPLWRWFYEINWVNKFSIVKTEMVKVKSQIDQEGGQYINILMILIGVCNAVPWLYWVHTFFWQSPVSLILWPSLLKRIDQFKDKIVLHEYTISRFHSTYSKLMRSATYIFLSLVLKGEG